MNNNMLCILLYSIFIVYTLQAAENTQSVRLALSSQTYNHIAKKNKPAMQILHCLSPDVSYDIEDLHKHLTPLPIFFDGIVQFDKVVIAYGINIAQKVVKTANKQHNRSCLALLYKKLIQEKDLKKILKDETVIDYSTQIYNKMRKDQQLTETFSKAFHISNNDGNYNIDTLLEERREAWRNFRLCGIRTLCDLRKEHLPEIQHPVLEDNDNFIERFLNLNKNVVLTETQQKLYTAYHVMQCALRQIHRTFDQITDIVFRDDFDNI